MNWLAAFSQVFLPLDKSGTPAYHSGGDFIKVIQQYERGQPGYSLYIKERNNRGLITSRKDFYWDILKGLDDTVRLDVFETLTDFISRISQLKLMSSNHIFLALVILYSKQWCLMIIGFQKS